MNQEFDRNVQTKKEREKKLSLYLVSFFNWITGGRYAMGEDISSIGIKPLGDRIYTRGKVTKVYSIHGFPFEFAPEFTQFMRNELRARYPNVQINFQIINTPLTLNVNNELFLKQMRAATEKYEQFKGVFESLSDSDKALGVRHRISAGSVLSFSKDDVEAKKRVVDSYKIVTDKVNSGSALVYSYIFIHATAPSNRVMNQFVTAIRNRIQSLKLQFRPVSSLLNAYLENFGPAAFLTTDPSKYGQAFLHDENVVHILPTATEGLVNTEGILMGINVKNASPLFLEFFKSGAGQTIMLCARTGWGKTHTAFQMVLSLLGDGCHVGVIDLKGNEYNKLAEYTECLEITLGGITPRCVNTLRLDDMSLSKADCMEAYRNAIDGTVRVLSLMTNLKPEEGNPIDLNSILEKAVTTLYNQSGIVPTNPDTFQLTKTLQYEDVLKYISELENVQSNPEIISEVCKMARFRCGDFLKTGGRFSEAFKNEITLDEVINAPLVIYSLDKNTQDDLDTVETIKVFMAQFLSTKKHHFRKRLGEQSALFSEEVQRMQDSSDIVKFLSSSVTGARSQNVMNVFLLNDLNRLDSGSFTAIKNNVSTAIIGSVSESDIKKLVVDYGFADIEQDIRTILADQEQYKNCFAIQYNTGYQHGNTMLKAYLPSNMNRSLRTRTIRE